MHQCPEATAATEASGAYAASPGLWSSAPTPSSADLLRGGRDDAPSALHTRSCAVVARRHDNTPVRAPPACCCLPQGGGEGCSGQRRSRCVAACGVCGGGAPLGEGNLDQPGARAAPQLPLCLLLLASPFFGCNCFEFGVRPQPLPQCLFTCWECRASSISRFNSSWARRRAAHSGAARPAASHCRCAGGRRSGPLRRGERAAGHAGGRAGARRAVRARRCHCPTLSASPAVAARPGTCVLGAQRQRWRSPLPSQLPRPQQARTPRATARRAAVTWRCSCCTPAGPQRQPLSWRLTWTACALPASTPPTLLTSGWSRSCGGSSARAA